MAIGLCFYSCGGECYENGEPEIYIKVHNYCLFDEIDAEKIKEPVRIYNECDSNMGTATITLPILENRKTYFFTDGANKIDSFTINYVLKEMFQSNCGYVVYITDLVIDSTASSLPFYHEFEQHPNDSNEIFCTYSSHSDYMRFYY